MNCFPGEDQTTEQEQEEQPKEVTDQGTETEPEGPLGDAEGAPRPLTKLDRKKVDQVWDEVRGSGEKPTADFIRKAIKKDDFDGSGVLEKNECKRLCESFQLRAKKNGDIFESWEKVFEFLDKNGDNTLDFEDIKYTMTVMWLMTKDRVSLQKVNSCQAQEEGTSASAV